ncbi:MAG TPA: squalene/phytoene synthase family protein, partial [Candidatus Eisenbacteria bacterium]|nr:squalene/phytoene synthase family protein [Candidatus Eisenbacteria bacterium]
MRTPSPSDREYCRRTLPRVSRTFALNIRLLSGRLLEAVRTAYLLCRAADTLEDSWPGPAAELDGRFAAFLAALAGDAGAADGLAAAAASRPTGAADVELLASLPVLLRALAALDPADAALVADGVRTLAAGMRRYAVRAAGRDPGTPYLDDDAELGDYCYVVAGCVGEMLTRLAARGLAHDAPAAAARRLALAPAVGEALQLTNIVLDWPADVRRGRCHVP